MTTAHLISSPLDQWQLATNCEHRRTDTVSIPNISVPKDSLCIPILYGIQ